MFFVFFQDSIRLLFQQQNQQHILVMELQVIQKPILASVQLNRRKKKLSKPKKKVLIDEKINNNKNNHNGFIKQSTSNSERFSASRNNSHMINIKTEPIINWDLKQQDRQNNQYYHPIKTNQNYDWIFQSSQKTNLVNSNNIIKQKIAQEDLWNCDEQRQKIDLIQKNAKFLKKTKNKNNSAKHKNNQVKKYKNEDFIIKNALGGQLCGWQQQNQIRQSKYFNNTNRTQLHKQYNFLINSNQQDLTLIKSLRKSLNKNPVHLTDFNNIKIVQSCIDDTNKPDLTNCRTLRNWLNINKNVTEENNKKFKTQTATDNNSNKIWKSFIAGRDMVLKNKDIQIKNIELQIRNDNNLQLKKESKNQNLVTKQSRGVLQVRKNQQNIYAQIQDVSKKLNVIQSNSEIPILFQRIIKDKKILKDQNENPDQWRNFTRPMLINQKKELINQKKKSVEANNNNNNNFFLYQDRNQLQDQFKSYLPNSFSLNKKSTGLFVHPCLRISMSPQQYIKKCLKIIQSKQYRPTSNHKLGTKNNYKQNISNRSGKGLTSPKGMLSKSGRYGILQNR